MYNGNSEMLIRKGSKIYTDIISNVIKQKNVSVFTMTGKNKFDFMPIEERSITHHQELEVYDLVIENTKGVQRTVTCSIDQQVHTVVRGFCSILRLNQLDVIIDDEGLPNKVISCESKILKDVDMCWMSLKYRNSPFISGIMLR